MGGCVNHIREWYLNHYHDSPVMVLFITVTLIMAVVFLFLGIFTSGRSILGMFLPNPGDTFMDHFDSIVYSSDHPYTKWDVIYPPLITLVYAAFGQVVIPGFESLSGAELAQALRSSQTGMMTFTITVISTLYLFHLLVLKQSKGCASKGFSEALALVFLFSFPMLYAFERGNCIIAVLTLCLIFLIWHDSEIKTLRYLSYVALALASSFKLYPAFLGLVLIRERRWSDAGMCILLGLALIFIPFLFTDGTPVDMFQNIFAYTGVAAGGGGMINITDWVYELLPSEWNLSVVALITNLMFIGVASFCVLFDDSLSGWKIVTLLCAVVTLGPGIGTGYVFIYMILPALYFVLSEKEMTRENFVFAIGFILIIGLIPGVMGAEMVITTVKSISTVLMALIIMFYSVRSVLKNHRRGVVC